MHIRELLLSSGDHHYWEDTPARVYDDNKDIFHLYKFENFSNNLRALRKSILSEQKRIDFDEIAVESESKAFPRTQFTQHGNPFYDTSKTKQLLVQKATDGTLVQYKGCPATLWALNPIFHEYKAKTFCKHVNREKRRVTEIAGWQLQRNIKGSKRQHAKYDKATK